MSRGGVAVFPQFPQVPVYARSGTTPTGPPRAGEGRQASVRPYAAGTPPRSLCEAASARLTATQRTCILPLPLDVPVAPVTVSRVLVQSQTRPGGVPGMPNICAGRVTSEES